MSDRMMLTRSPSKEKKDNSLFPGVCMAKNELYVILGDVLFSLFIRNM